MKQIFLLKSNASHLCLFFAGWGMDETPFRSYHPADCDLMICYDYRSLDFNESLLKGYASITLIAWSMGVWVASLVMHQLPVKQSIAINGTLYPIDESRGISPAIFEGTLRGLNNVSLQKFQRRMCSTSAAYKAFLEISPKRSVEELKEELAAIKQHYLSALESEYHWHKAIIGSADRIFPSENQRCAWSRKETTVIQEMEAAHYQEEVFKLIIENYIFN